MANLVSDATQNNKKAVIDNAVKQSQWFVGLEFAWRSAQNHARVPAKPTHDGVLFA